MNILKRDRVNLLNSLEDKIGYKFTRIDILNKALTHSSFANEQKDEKIKHNERLEFLGDSVLGLVISSYLFSKYPNYPEGELTKLRAIIVCESSLASVSREIRLGKYLLLGNGEEATGGRNRNSILADAFEALIGAIYIDGGIDSAKEFIINKLTNTINQAISGKLFTDYKTELQEIIQKKNNAKIEYKVIYEEGPDHNKVFHVQVGVSDKILGQGSGKSKKEAEQNAAKQALLYVGGKND